MSAYNEYFKTFLPEEEEEEEKRNTLDFGVFENHVSGREKRSYKYTHPHQLRQMTQSYHQKASDAKQNDLLGAIEMMTNPPPPILPMSVYTERNKPPIKVKAAKTFAEHHVEAIQKTNPGFVIEEDEVNRMKPKKKPVKPVVPIEPISPGLPITPVPINPKPKPKPVPPKPKPVPPKPKPAPPKPKKQFVEPPLPPGARYIFPNNKVPKKSTIVKGSKLTDGPDGKPYIPKPKPIIPVKPKINPDAPIVVHGVTAPPMGTVEGDPGYKKPFFSGGQEINWMPKTGTTMRR